MIFLQLNWPVCFSIKYFLEKECLPIFKYWAWRKILVLIHLKIFFSWPRKVTLMRRKMVYTSHLLKPFSITLYNPKRQLWEGPLLGIYTCPNVQLSRQVGPTKIFSQLHTQFVNNMGRQLNLISILHPNGFYSHTLSFFVVPLHLFSLPRCSLDCTKI